MLIMQRHLAIKMKIMMNQAVLECQKVKKLLNNLNLMMIKTLINNHHQILSLLVQIHLQKKKYNKNRCFLNKEIHLNKYHLNL